jgi:prepilin-type N-terminal cleavage/methylation domain-containing protein
MLERAWGFLLYSKYMTYTPNRGFTLIELLVVIAIIGILSTLVLAVLNLARIDSRDAKRVADIKELSTAVQLYYDTYTAYPAQLSDLVPTYIPVLSGDPINQVPYYYDQVGGGSSFHLGANLEDASHKALASDRDIVTDTINGSDASDCGGGSNSGRRCYDVGP